MKLATRALLNCVKAQHYVVLTPACYEKQHDAEVMQAGVRERIYYVIHGADVICSSTVMARAMLQ